MPIKINDGLPAAAILKRENIFIMSESRAGRQDIRPLHIAILNLMPQKQTTEVHLLRLLSNSAIQIEVDLIHPASYRSKNTSKEHLATFYKTFDQIKGDKYDGLIITGAPLETFDFEEVIYWDELCSILSWSKTNVTSTLHICWAAQAALYYHYKIRKHPVGNKISGVFDHTISNTNEPIVRGFDDKFLAPHSRYSEISGDDINDVDNLDIISKSDEAGIYIVTSKKGGEVYVTGHSEYDPLTLKEEYERDLEKGINPPLPKNYFPHDNPLDKPVVSWRSHGHLLFSNWLNYYVYQATPYDLNKIK